MAVDTGTPGGPDERPGGRPKRPPPTIDLQATEVAPATEASPKDTTDLEDAAETVPPDADISRAESPEPAREGPREDQPKTTVDSSSAGSARAWPGFDSLVWPVAAGAAGGALLSFVVVAGLWLSGGLHRPAAGTSGVVDRLGAIETRVREIEQRPPSGQGASMPPDILRRLETAEQNSRGIEAIESRLARAEQMLAKVEKAPGTPSQTDKELAERVGAAETSARAADAGLRAIAERVTEVSRRINDIEGLARDARTRAEQTASNARETQKMAESLNAEATSDLTAITSRLAALEERANELQRTTADLARSSPDPAARFALAAAMLNTAVESGRAFSSQLATVRPFVSDQSLLVPLAPYAEQGLGSLAMLQQSFREVVARIGESGRQSAPREGSLVERLQINAERLVRIRPIGEPEPAEDSGLVARAQKLVANGDLSGAVAELEKLPPNQKALADPWIKQAQARTDALASARKLSANAAAALGQKP